MAAGCFRVRLAREPSPAGERTARVLAGYRRTDSDLGRGQARAFWAADLAAVLATLPPAAGLLLHSGDAEEQGERPPLGRRRRRGGRRRGPRHRPPQQDEPGGRDEGRGVREGRVSPAPSRTLRAAASPGAEGPGRARSRRRWWGLGFVAAAGPPASSRGRGPAMRRIALESQPTKVAARGARCRRRRWHRRGRDSLPWFKLGRGR